ncbi:MAG: hypothetical protein CYG59_03730 [Chloroflexi bacterium]|nr:MAG: hypothetical protein CYG59_03730 [Chloroflexota bacterium]
MNRLFVRIVWMLLIGSALVACSFGSTPDPTTQLPPTPTARPVSIQSGVPIKGRLLFVQDGNLYLYQGTDTRQITKDGTTRDPAWSPEGSRIAFVRREESYSDIYVLNANGGLPTQVTFNGGQATPRSQEFMHQVVWASAPTWTPDGSELVFLSQVAPPSTEPLTEYPLAIYRYPLRLVGQRQPTNDDLLVQAENADLHRPDWAPDNSLLAFARVPRDGGPQQIRLFDPETAAEQPYPGIPDNAYDPAWSPDGRWLAFAARVESNTDIWVIPHPSIGGSAVRLTNLGVARAPAWSPDGTQLAFVHVGDAGTDLYVLPITQANGTISGGQATPLTNNGHLDANSGLSWGQ